VTPFNQTHTFAVSTVYAPSFEGSGLGVALANNNQLGVILQTNSGLPFNIRSNRDLNLDGVTNDRPLGLERNAGRLGTVLYLDLRYSRFVPLNDRRKIELFFEAKNLFNRLNLAGVNRVVTTDLAGNPASPILLDGGAYPDAGKSGYDQRQMQLGAKFVF
jgi:hypothetical protein